MDSRRLFVCVDPPAGAVAHLGAAVDALEVSRAETGGRPTRLTARDRWHVTLAFLGDVPGDRIGDAAAALDRAWAAPGWAGPAGVSFAGGGVFGQGKLAILWAGLGGDVAGLRTLAAAIRREFGQVGLPFDGRPFRPHLTVSRPGARIDPALLARDVATLAGYQGPQWTVESMHLVASELGPAGPTYTTLHTTPDPATGVA
jgi:2'-5' RNA ligase